MNKVMIIPTATQDLWSMLKKKGFKFVHLRGFNQDPLENTFGGVRDQNGRDTNPTCSHFRSALKTLLVNNFVSGRSPSKNCEDDDTSVLNTLRTFLMRPAEKEEECEADQIYFIDDADDVFEFTAYSKQAIQIHAYLAGYIAKKIFKVIHVCKTCRRDLIGPSTNVHDVIEAKAYNHKALLRPDTWFVNLFGEMCDILHHYLPKLILENNIKSKLKCIIHNFLNPINFNCTKHDVFPIFSDMLIEFYIHTYIKNVNNILRGKDLRCISDNDPVKILACKRYETFRKRKAAIKKLKQIKN